MERELEWLESAGPAGLLDLLQRQVAGSPSLLAPAGEPLRYGDLVRQTGHVGRVLRAAGIGKSATVALILPNGPLMASAFLGIASFSTCAPLNPQYGYRELEFYLADLGASAVVLPAGSDCPARAIARSRGMKVLDLLPMVAAGARFRLEGFESIPDIDAEPGRADDIALVLHTSGTTSRPKMVPLTHRNLCASAMAVARTLALTQADACLNMMPLFHIHGLVGALLSSMFAGGSVICTPGFSAAEFPGWIRHCRPTWYSAVPTIHQSVLESVRETWSGNDHALRFIRSSSSALPPVVMTRLEETFGVPVIESYGMTEAAHQMASNPLPPRKRKPGSVGMASGPEVAIMDDSGALLPAGQTGEIVIRGANVTAGYAGDPEASRNAFANGWFRTGDQGRLDEDGYLYITGRLKEIINRAGEKVSPREVDEVLLEHPDVLQAVTFAMPHATLGEDVLAAVVGRAGAVLVESELRSFAFSRLAPWKVPSQMVIVAEIPRGPTGKVQRIGLHEKLAPLLKTPFLPPNTPTQSMLAEIWAEILGIEQAGIHDNFFTLGGDSLSAMRVVARIRDQSNVDVPAAGLFRHPTIAQFASVIDSASEAHMARLLAYVEGLSDEEVKRLLQDDTP